VIDMALLSVIRRWALRDQLSIREIARRTGLSRNTIRKYLRSGTVEPAFRVPERPSKLDPFADKLSAWLKTEAGKSRKQRRPLKQLHADLVALGYEGSYSRVAAFARKWKADRQREQGTAGRGTFVPLAFPARGGLPVRLERGLGDDRRGEHQAPGRARQALAQPGVPGQGLSAADHEMLFDAHRHAFRVFGGVPRRGIYDSPP
jgi:transposase